MTFEELEKVVDEIEEKEKEIARLRALHIDILLGNVDGLDDDFLKKYKNSILNMIEDIIDNLIFEIRTLKGVE